MNFEPLPGTGQACEGFCIIKSVEKKMTSKGSQYLDLVLADNDGETGAKLWDYKETPDMIFANYDFVKVRGRFSPFNDTQQFYIDKIRKVTPADNVNIDDYVPSACLSGEVMLAEIEQVIATFKDEELKRLVNAVIAKYRDKLLYWPAAKNLHHAVRGGLLMHTLTILRMAYSVCSIYSYVNYDLLCTGAILHDIAKIDELIASNAGISGEYSVRGNLIGHLVMGAIEVDRTGREQGVSEETLTLVEHMLISHHGVPEFGAAKYPMTVEAMVLSFLDDMDAKLYIVSNAVDSTEPGSFSAKQWSLDNRIIYNHGKAYDGGVNLI